MYRVIKFNEKDWLKPWSDINTELGKKGKIDFEKYFFKLKNYAVFAKTMENVKKRRDIKRITTKRRKNSFGVTTKLSCNKKFSHILLPIEMRKTLMSTNTRKQ